MTEPGRQVHLKTPNKPLSESQQNLAAILEHSEDGIIITDEKGVITTWSRSLQAVTGCAAANALGKFVWDVQAQHIPYNEGNSPSSAQLRSVIEPILQTGELTRQLSLVERDLLTANGDLKTVQMRGFVIPTAKGWCLGAMLRDITLQKAAERQTLEFNQALEYRVAERTTRLEALTQELEHEIEERKQVDEALLTSQQQLTFITDNMLDVVLHIDSGGVIQFASPSITAVLGYKISEMEGASLLDYLDPADKPKAWDIGRGLVAAHTQSMNLELRFVHKNGDTLWMELAVRLLYDPQGGWAGAVVGMRNNTLRRLAEEAMMHSEERFRKFFELPLIGAAILTPDLRWLVVNNRLCSMLGYTPAELGERTLLDLILPDGLSAELESLLNLGNCEIEGISLEKHFTRKDGALIEVALSAMCSQKADGQPDYIIALLSDITARKQGERQLQAQRHFLRQVIDSDLNLMAVKDSAGRFTLVNKTLAEFYGRSPEELIGKSEADLGNDPYVSAEFLHRLGEVIVGSQPRLVEEETMRDWHGRQHYLQTILTPVRGGDGIEGEPQLLCVSTDITQRKERERALEAVTAVSAALRTAKNHAQMIPIILDEVTRAMDSTGAMLLSVDHEDGGMQVELGVGELADRTGDRLKPGEGISGRVVQSGEIFVTDHIYSDSGFVRMGFMKQDYAMVCLPYGGGGHAAGVFWVARTAPFGTSEINVLSAVANIAGSALHRAALFEQTEERLQRLNALHIIDATISASRDLPSVLEVLLYQVINQLGADAVDILLIDPLTHKLKYAAGLGFRSNFINFTSLEMGEGYAGRAARERRPVSVLDMTAEKDSFSRSLLLAGEEFLSFHCVPLVVRDEVKGVLEVFNRRRVQISAEWLEFLETLGGQAAIAVDNTELLEDLQRTNKELMSAYDDTIAGWSKALELRDLETKGHSHRVPDMTIALARHLGVEDETRLTHMRRGALLHDIGKMGIPDEILLKRGPLKEDEWEIMRLHPGYAHQMLSAIPFLLPAREIPYCHHEKWDGSGYPRHLKMEEIPIEARIFAIVDVWQALLEDRCYRPAWPEEKVRQYLVEESDAHFDPRVVKKFFELF